MESQFFDCLREGISRCHRRQRRETGSDDQRGKFGLVRVLPNLGIPSQVGSSKAHGSPYPSLRKPYSHLLPSILLETLVAEDLINAIVQLLKLLLRSAFIRS